MNFMDYKIPVKFVGIENRDPLDVIDKIAQQQYEGLSRLIKEFHPFIPSLRYYCVTSSMFNDKKIERELLDEAWLEKKLLTLKFAVWRDFGIMGVIGYQAENQINDLILYDFEFKSGNPAYDYEAYPNLPFFDSVKQKAQSLTEDNIRKYFKLKETEDIADLEYYRKSYLYKSVFSEINFDTFVYSQAEKDAHLKVLAVNVATNELMRLAAIDLVKAAVAENNPFNERKE